VGGVLLVSPQGTNVPLLLLFTNELTSQFYVFLKQLKRKVGMFPSAFTRIKSQNIFTFIEINARLNISLGILFS